MILKSINKINMKRVVLFFLIVLAGSAVHSQQLSLRSQYMMDDFLLNPAIAGTKTYNPISTTFRRQWSGIEGAPVTQTISFHGYAGKNLGLGGYLFNDVSGPTRRSGVNFSVSYQLKLSERNNQRLAFGLSALLFQNVFDATKLTTDVPDDIAIMESHESVFAPDANFGIYYFNDDKYYVGLSAHHLIQSDVDIFNTLDEITNTVDRTYFFNAGYKFVLGENFDLTPSVLLQYIEAQPYQFDGNLTLSFKDKVWLGGSYRYDDAIVGMIGFNLNMLSIGYSYDYSISDIQNYNDGSHEIYLGVRLNRNDGERGRIPWNSRNRLFTP
jgi:type IX secretion system PorP/SprF family membrane protein